MPVCCVNRCALTLFKVELTDSGKFIEVESEETEKTEPETTTPTDKVESDIDKSVTASTNTSPAKSVRIMENGAKMNGDNAEAVRFVFTNVLMVGMIYVVVGKYNFVYILTLNYNNSVFCRSNRESNIPVSF